MIARDRDHLTRGQHEKLFSLRVFFWKISFAALPCDSFLSLKSYTASWGSVQSHFFIEPAMLYPDYICQPRRPLLLLLFLLPQFPDFLGPGGWRCSGHHYQSYHFAAPHAVDSVLLVKGCWLGCQFGRMDLSVSVVRTWRVKHWLHTDYVCFEVSIGRRPMSSIFF